MPKQPHVEAVPSMLHRAVQWKTLTCTLPPLLDYQHVCVFFGGGGSLGLASLESLWFCTLFPSSILPSKSLGMSGSHLVVRLLRAAARTNAFVQGGLVRQFPPPMFHGSDPVRAVKGYGISYAQMLELYVVKALKRRVGIDTAKLVSVGSADRNEL